jgi:hypothetical protein
MGHFYNVEGEPISVDEWGRLMENREYQVVRQTRLADGSLVSTVWLGLDHNWGDGQPLIFETMVFTDRGTTDGQQWRYATYHGALAGHEAIVKRLTPVPPEELGRAVDDYLDSL